MRGVRGDAHGWRCRPESHARGAHSRIDVAAGEVTADARAFAAETQIRLVQEEELAKLSTEKKVPGSASLFVGESGTMVMPHVGMPRLYPEDKFPADKVEEVKGSNHYHAWIDAILSNSRTSDGVHYAGPLTETVQLGNGATRVPGKVLEWDAEGLKFRNSPEADKLLTKDYRKGFEIPS